MVKISLRRRHAQTAKMVLPAILQTILNFFSEILNLEGHLYRFIGSKVTAILLNKWILPTCGVASGRVFPAACAAGLFYLNKQQIYFKHVPPCSRASLSIQ